ncbi:Tigger transposable element-derived protein 1 [Nosema granulosis]|uniref:Tigger transposable element-derived protein 1 n=1 Tax=Nosema granulosis TaxID=83296 RepID=A0A9P6H3V5_9MICR|nr:Tigger transposable element-derived protein 1 [Nosema granulosis]
MIQPLDQGIINSFKTLYKKKLNAKLDHGMELSKTKRYYDVLKEFKLIDLLKVILESWDDVSNKTIQNCYRKAIDNAMGISKELLDNNYLIIKLKKLYHAITKMMFIEDIKFELEKSGLPH